MLQLQIYIYILCSVEERNMAVMLRRLIKLVSFGLCFLPLKARTETTIALVAPKAGSYQQQGLELAKGVQQGIDEINNDGGLLGEKITLLTIDDQCNDSIAVSTAQMLTILKQYNIKLIIGPYCANSFDKVADIYAKAQLFQIIPITVNYTQAKTVKKGLVKMLGYTNQQAKDFFDYYNATMAGSQIALVSNASDEESTEEVRAVSEEFRKHGKSIVLKSYTYDMTAKDYNKLAENILADGNAAVFIQGTPKNIRKMAYALKDKDENITLFVNKYTAGEEFFQYMDGLAEGIYFMALRGKDDNPEFAETLVNLRLKGFDTEGLSLYGYSAVNLWKNLVTAAKSFNYNKVSTQANKGVKTEFGNQMFHNGAPDTSESYAIFRYENGELKKVY